MDVNEESVAPWKLRDPAEESSDGMSDVTTATGCAVSRRRARILEDRPCTFRTLLTRVAVAEDERGLVPEIGERNIAHLPKREVIKVGWLFILVRIALLGMLGTTFVDTAEASILPRNNLCIPSTSVFYLCLISRRPATTDRGAMRDGKMLLSRTHSLWNVYCPLSQL